LAGSRPEDGGVGLKALEAHELGAFWNGQKERRWDKMIVMVWNIWEKGGCD